LEQKLKIQNYYLNQQNHPHQQNLLQAKKSTSKNPKFVRNKPNSNVDESITIKNPKKTQEKEDPLLSSQNNSKKNSRNDSNKIEIKKILKEHQKLFQEN